MMGYLSEVKGTAMGIFNDILNKLRGKAPTETPAKGTTPILQDVDVQAVLAQLAAKKGGGGNYKVSIVDLLKLLGIDSSLAARKKLAEELNVHAGEHGSAEQNIALHKAVLRKVAENGGKVPDSLLD
jgi:hypothetical protein